MDASAPSPILLPAPSCEVRDWFAEEVQPHEAALRAYLRGRFPGLVDPEDVIQDTYIRLIRAREHGTVRSTKALLFVTARNLAVDFFRRRGTMRGGDLVNLASEPVLEQLTEAELHRRDRRLHLLEEALRALPERCREVMIMKKIEGRSYEEIAMRMGISHATISAHVTAGVKKCREYLQARGAGGDEA